MHFRFALIALLIAVCCADTVVGRASPWERRADSAAPAPASGAPSNSKSPQPKQTDSTTTAGKGGNTRSVPQTSTKTNDNAASTNTALSAAKNGTESSEDAELPIEPSITPAVGIAGVILIITGIAYTLIGIKHEWLLVFLSTAYLASLGVTVLIIYVMNPPVSDAIQVAYFFAAFVTGLIFGGFSLIFREVTKGFAGLVGGFCFAMWFLCLKSGGLITSETGKAIMIIVFAAVGWTVAFTKYTKNYGSIFCTSIGGAMITIIGIDCFTRAGLKEFWIYVWALNDQEFPLHTRTYPITRGMRAELACTIILCAIGLVSQVKVWKIVKERRAKKEGERLQDENSRENRDERYGRAVELRNSKSLAAWEAVYGEKNTDSEAGTSVFSLKKSANVTEREVGDVELEELDTRKEDAGTSGNKDIEVTGTAPQLRLDLDGQSEKGSIDFAEPPIPPLPFSLLTGNNGPPATNDDDSIYRPPTSAHETYRPALSEREQNGDDDESPFDLETIEDDRASSIAATLDEDPDFDALSTKRLSRFSLAPSVHVTKERPVSQDVSRTVGEGEEVVEENDDEELVKPAASKSNANTGNDGDKAMSEAKDEPVKISETNLPRSVSRVAHVYRTNEWAKHVAEADEPDPIDDALDADEPAVHIDVGRPQEAPRPLDARALSPEQMQPQLFRATSTSQPTLPIRPSSNDAAAHHSQRQSSNALHVQTKPDLTPIQAFNRQSSTSSLSQAKREARKLAPSPVPPTLVESPVEDTFPATGTLLDARNHRLQTRPTTTSLTGLVSPPRTAQTLDTTKLPSTNEEMSLSQRRSLLARSTSAQSHFPAAPPRFSTASPIMMGGQSGTPTPRQLQRFSSVNNHNPSKQNAMLAQWRESLQQEVYAQQQPGFATGQPLPQPQQMQMQMQHETGRESRAETPTAAPAAVPVMRASDLMERHRSVMRKMQARANEADKSNGPSKA